MTHLIAHCKALGHEVVLIEPTQYHAVAFPVYPEVELSVDTWNVGSRILEVEPDSIHIFTEGGGYSAYVEILTLQTIFFRAARCRNPHIPLEALNSLYNLVSHTISGISQRLDWRSRIWILSLSTLVPSS
jgi:hypothetical protein